MELNAEGYFETSAQSGEGVNELFLSLFQIAERLDRIVQKPNQSDSIVEGVVVVESSDSQPRRRGGCCGV